MRPLLLTIAALAAGLSAAPGEEPLVKLEDGRLVARCERAAAPMKPYVKELFSPSGVQVTVDSPADHFHHHGLMFALGADDVDFWTEKPFEKFGKQVPRADGTATLPGGLKQRLDWVGPDGKPLLTEMRVVRIQSSRPGGPNVLTWVSDFETAGRSPVKLWGRHYFGLGIRFPADLDAKARYVLPAGTSTGRVVRGDETLRAAPWCAATGEIGGKPVTVAMWDGPQNPRRAVWFTMTKPFSYLSATLDLEEHPLEAKPGGTLSLRYGVAVFDGLADAAQIGKARDAWLAEEKSKEEAEMPR